MPNPKSVESRERDKLNEIAREYRAKGYDVVLSPGQVELPHSLRPFQPDMLARSGNETIVVEVKSKQSLASPEIGEMARRIDAIPGWRFEMVVLGPSSSIEHSAVFEEEEIVRRIQSARLLTQQDPGAALVLAWSATEAVLRRLSLRADIKLDNQSPLALLRQLRLNGVLTEDDYAALRKSAELRNAQAHGIMAYVDAGEVHALIDRINNLRLAEAAVASQLKKQDLPRLIKEALFASGGSATLVEVARHIWDHYENALKESGDLLYTWQYDMRWAANILRHSGDLVPAESSPRGVWELATKARGAA